MHNVVVDGDSSLLPRDDNISGLRGQIGARCHSSESTMPGYSFVSFDNVVNR